jgi:hypothetical protein
MSNTGHDPHTPQPCTFPGCESTYLATYDRRGSAAGTGRECATGWGGPATVAQLITLPAHEHTTAGE